MIKIKFADIKKQSALMAIIRFFALMLIITLVARALNSTVMPTVATVRAFSTQLTKSVNTSVMLTAYGGEAVLLPRGILVNSVKLTQGAQVRAGDCIATLSLAELENAVKAKTAALNKLSTQLAQLQKKRPTDDYALKQAQQQLDRAYEAHNKAYESDDENAIEAARVSAQAAEDVRNAALHSFELAQQAANDQAAQNKADAAILGVDISTIHAELAELKAIIESEGKIFAPFDGVITSLSLTAGEESRRAAIFVAKASEGLIISGSANGENAKKVTAGMRITLVQGEQTDSAEILSVAENASGEIAFEARLSGTRLQPGSANAEIIILQNQYPLCLPSQCLRQDVNGTFVYTLETRQTVLGESTVLVRTEIEVLENDGSFAAVKGAIGATDSVVESSERPLSNGARVKTE